MLRSTVTRLHNAVDIMRPYTVALEHPGGLVNYNVLASDPQMAIEKAIRKAYTAGHKRAEIEFVDLKKI